MCHPQKHCLSLLPPSGNRIISTGNGDGDCLGFCRAILVGDRERYKCRLSRLHRHPVPALLVKHCSGHNPSYRTRIDTEITKTVVTGLVSDNRVSKRGCPWYRYLRQLMFLIAVNEPSSVTLPVVATHQTVMASSAPVMVIVTVWVSVAPSWLVTVKGIGIS